MHAGEAIALSGRDESESLRQAYKRFAGLAGKRGLPSVERFFSEEVHRGSGSKLEALMSALWCLQVSVLDLFSRDVRAMIDGRAETL